jgi:uncharacterized coiled-coil protein SlyX
MTDIYSNNKYVNLLESQLIEKDETIKDLRETNKFLSITNSKLNEQIRFLLEKPQNDNTQEGGSEQKSTAETNF